MEQQAQFGAARRTAGRCIGDTRAARVEPLVIAPSVLLFFLSLWAVVATYPTAVAGHVDFRHLYTAGYMVRTGLGSELYSYAKNEETQTKQVGPAQGTLTFNHLAYEGLIFVPFSYLSYRRAYAAFFLLNVLLLAGTIRALWPYFSKLVGIWQFLPAATVLCFFPVSIALVEGQDSLLLLALFVASMVATDQHNELLGGALLGLTFFKFQYALPMVFLFLLWKRWRFLGGVAASAAAVTALSFWVTGISGMTKYVPYLLSISAKYTPDQGMRHGIHTEGMANLRGLVASVVGASDHNALLLTLVFSIILIVWASFKHPSLPGALLAAVLVSYHHVISDASLLILPLGLMLADYESPTPRKGQVALLASLTYLILPLLLFVGIHFSLLALPLLALFALWDGTYWSPYPGGQAFFCPQKDTK